ncbi:MAG: glycosyltransferase family 9 protein [Chthoniobacterales bacterium]|nr:glycosyltransferase family 9 protein [Chthoniobacterales bacterium]
MGKPGKRKGQLSLSSSANLLAHRALFGLLAGIRPPRARPISLSAGSKVLVFSTAGLGDALLDSAGIRALASGIPGIRIHAVVHHRRTDIARHNPLLEKLYFLRKGPLAFLGLWHRLRKSGPWDAVLYLSCHDPEARCLGYLLAPDATVGLAWRTGMPWLCARNMDEPGLRKAHLAVQAVRVAVGAGATPSEPRMVYKVADEDRGALEGILKQLGFPQEPGVTFQLGGGGGPFRDWPVEHFLKLAALTHAAHMGPLFLLGGPDHKKKADAFAEAARSAGIPFFNVVGLLPLPQSAALLERTKCLVSTDTGIMHLAFALGTPTVALLHCTPGDARVGPLVDRHKHVVIQLPKPDGYRTPSDASMSDLRPEAVFSGVKEIYFRDP